MITNTKGFTGHAMGAGVEDVVAVKALETGIVPPVPNYREPDPDLGALNLSKGGAHPVRYALRLAAGFGSQVAMALLKWTPMPDGQRRSPDALGYDYRIVDPAAWQRWLDDIAGYAGARMEVDHRRLRIVDVGTPSTSHHESSIPVPYAGQLTTPQLGCDGAPVDGTGTGCAGIDRADSGAHAGTERGTGRAGTGACCARRRGAVDRRCAGSGDRHRVGDDGVSG